MQYLATPSGPRVLEAMRAGRLGALTTPRVGSLPPIGVPWAADNGCFSTGYPGDDAFIAWLRAVPEPLRASCLFATAPDVVGDAALTALRSEPFLGSIRACGFPVGYVAQDGADVAGIPWRRLDALFIGGSTTFKLGPVARQLVAHARGLGKHVHMGRVNSLRRLLYADAIGVDSVDGTIITYAPRLRLPEVLGWLDAADLPVLFGADQVNP